MSLQMKEWISVKDKMPEQAGLKVLVSAYAKNGRYSVFTAFLGYGDGNGTRPITIRCNVHTKEKIPFVTCGQ